MIRLLLLSTLLLTADAVAAAAASPPAPAAPSEDFARMNDFLWFIRLAGSQPERLHVRVGTFGEPFWPEGERLTYWFVMDSQAREGGVWTRGFTNSELCPAAAAVLQRVATLSMPHPDVPRSGAGWDRIIADGTVYTLGGTARDSSGHAVDYQLLAEAGSVMGEWIEELVAALDGCWRPTAPD